jgi:hypothetical protein
MFAVKQHPFKLAALAGAVLIAGALHTTQAHAWTFNWSSEPAVAGSGNVVSSTRVVTGFQGITVSVPGNIKVVQGDAEGLVIKTDDNIAPLIETVVDGNTLRIRFAKKAQSVRVKQLDITVFAKNVNALTIEGSGAIQTDKLKSDKLKASIEGSGDMVLNGLEINQLDVSVAGSGDVQGDGKAESLTTSIAGSGDVRLGNVMAKSTRVSIAGSGNAQVWATEKLKVSIAGSGDVRYYGDATVSSSIAGAGNVQRMGAAPVAKKP